MITLDVKGLMKTWPAIKEVNKTLSSTPYGQTECGEKKNDENRQCYKSSLDVDETSEMEMRSEKNKDEDPQTTPFDQMEVDEGPGRMIVVESSYKMFRAAWENREKRQKCTTRMKTMRTTITRRVLRVTRKGILKKVASSPLLITFSSD